MRNEKVSVVIPSKERIDKLFRALNSLAKQTVKPLEVIIVDDGSARPYDLRDVSTMIDFDLRLIRISDSRGGSAARNLGVRAARGEWVSFLDDDDMFYPEKIEVLSDYLDSHPEVDLVYHSARINMVNERVTYETRPEDLSVVESPLASLLVKNVVGGTSMVACRKSALIEAGLFDEAMPALQDYDLWLRMAKNGSRFGRIDRVLVNYECVTSANSVSHGVERNREALQRIDVKFKEEYSSLDRSREAASELWRADMQVHKALLSGRWLLALRLQLKRCFYRPNARALVVLFIMTLGRTILFRVRSVF